MSTFFCLHLNKEIQTKLVAIATISMPAEYVTREICHECGEVSCTDDTIETDIVSFVKGIENPTFSDIDTQDCPDFCDAWLSAGEINGRELSELELEYINENAPEWINEMVNLQFNGG